MRSFFGIRSRIIAATFSGALIVLGIVMLTARWGVDHVAHGVDRIVATVDYDRDRRSCADAARPLHLEVQNGSGWTAAIAVVIEAIGPGGQNLAHWRVVDLGAPLMPGSTGSACLEVGPITGTADPASLRWQAGKITVTLPGQGG